MIAPTDGSAAILNPHIRPGLDIPSTPNTTTSSSSAATPDQITATAGGGYYPMSMTMAQMDPQQQQMSRQDMIVREMNKRERLESLQV